MAITPVTSSTGDTILRDVGTLSYNGITFSCLYKSTVSGTAVPDNAGRAIRYVEWSVQVEGIVTLSAGDTTTDRSWLALRQKLDVFGGALSYDGKGFGKLDINTAGGVKDVAWGPKTETLEFQPLGSSRAAFVRWRCTVRILDLPTVPSGTRLVQFNYEANVSYDDQCYSTISLTGTMEIPLTRSKVTDHAVPDCVDNFRQRFLDIAFDLTKFRVTQREFRTSRDKRTSEWEYTAEELPRMGLPYDAPWAKGSFSVRPQKTGMGFVQWVCTLRVTYVIRPDKPAREAWWNFLFLWKFRMDSSAHGLIPGVDNNAPAAQQPPIARPDPLVKILIPIVTAVTPDIIRQIMTQQQALSPSSLADKKAFPISFSFDEGLHLDSKTMTFEASWMLICTFTSLFLATGLWRWLGGTVGGTEWALTVEDIMGWKGNLVNRVDPGAEIIVDLGVTAEGIDGLPFTED